MQDFYNCSEQDCAKLHSPYVKVKTVDKNPDYHREFSIKVIFKEWVCRVWKIKNNRDESDTKKYCRRVKADSIRTIITDRECADKRLWR